MRPPHVFDLCRHPLVVAPMAGGPTTTDLVAAACAAGALGFLAGGYQRVDALRRDMAAVRTTGCDAFGVNLFVPGRPTADPDAVADYLVALDAEATALGTALDAPAWDDDDYDDKVALVVADPPPAVSFTFGVPNRDVVSALQSAGTLVVLTVTTPGEAEAALRVEPDALCAQGAEAGAHRGSFGNDDRPGQDVPVRALVTGLVDMAERTATPLIAAGGVGGPDDVTALLTSGAALVQAGTAFLRCRESGAHPCYKAALGDPAYETTALTRAFSGRRARALVNAMVRAHPSAPAAYPEVNNATRPLRAAAAAAGDTDHMSLYAGTGFRRVAGVAGGVAEEATGEVVERLVSGVGR